VLAVLLATNAKPYYLAPAYMALFAAGAVVVEAMRQGLAGQLVRGGIVVLVVASGALSAPLAKPVLSTDAYLRYTAALGMAPNIGERHEMGRLPQHFADMHGWPELASNVAKIYHALSAADRARACIFAQNYGQAGAVDVLGAPSISRSLRLLRVPSKAKPTMWVGS